MTRQTTQDANRWSQLLELLAKEGFDGMKEALTTLLNQAMKLERTKYLGAEPYQRTDARRSWANGFKPKTLDTRLGRLVLDVPQTRDGKFYPACLEKGLRSERALKLAVAEMYLRGVSTRKVHYVMQKICGLDVTSAQVSRAAAMLDAELARWRRRPLGEVAYLVLDAHYEKARVGEGVLGCAVLVAVGVLPDGRRMVLGVDCSCSEAESNWREFLFALARRGMHGVKYVVSDDHAGLRAALATCLPGVPCRGASSTSCATPCTRCRGPTRGRPSHETSATSWTPPIGPSRCAASGRWPTSTRTGPGSHRGWSKTSRSPWPCTDCRPTTASACARPTCSSGSTASSRGAPTSWACSRTRTRSCGWSVPWPPNSPNSGRAGRFTWT